MVSATDEPQNKKKKAVSFIMLIGEDIKTSARRFNIFQFSIAFRRVLRT